MVIHIISRRKNMQFYLSGSVETFITNTVTHEPHEDRYISSMYLLQDECLYLILSQAFSIPSMLHAQKWERLVHKITCVVHSMERE